MTAFLGGGFQTLRDRSMDPQLPFSSVPAIAGVLVAQNVALIYNSYQAGSQPPPGRPFAVQNTVQGYPSAANATTAFNALRTTWQGNLFQNLVQRENLGSGWQESFCQVGNFVSSNQQTTQWFVCMARSGPYVVTVSIGGFPGLDANFVAAGLRTYFDAAQRAIQ